MAQIRKKQRFKRQQQRRRTTKGNIRVETLEARQLLAANVLNDSFQATGDITLNVLANDATGNEIQNVSSFQMDFDPASVDESSNSTDWFVPERPGQPDVPQRSLITGAVYGDGGNFGDIDLVRDNDNDPATPESTDLDASEGVVLPVMRDNTPVDGSNTNLGVLKYNTDGGGRTWVAISAAPENSGENSVPFSGAFFPYSDGWVGGSWDAELNVNSGGAGMTVTGGGGQYEAEVAGVTNSYEDGFLFGVSAQNGDDNYTRTRPIDGGKWSVRVRDNASELDGSEGSGTADDFNLLYIPRGSQGLIGGVVDASESGSGAMDYSTGEFEISREGDGFWRVSIPGHDITSGAMIMEAYDLSQNQPRNSYFSYDDAGDGSGDIIIRQFGWNSNTETPLNTDFVFFFVPFENQVNATHGLTLSSLDATSSQGVALTSNADGTIDYTSPLDPAQVLALPEGSDFVDTFTYDATDGTATSTATVTVTIKGANDAPEVTTPFDDIILDEGGAAESIDLANFITDVDTGDTLTFSVDDQQNPLFDAEVTGSTLTVTPDENQFGTTTGVVVTATDTLGASVSVTIPVAVIPVDDDGVVAVDDSGTVTDKVTPAVISAIENDFHEDTTPFSVSAAEISADPLATGNGPQSQWTVIGTTPAPNDFTVQTDGNQGDVGVGRNGVDLQQAQGVLLGTARENASPYSTINTDTVFGMYSFNTGQGIGNGERNTAINAGFFPFAEGWTGGQVDSDGTLLGGVGVSQSNIVKVRDGLFEITIPEASEFGGGFEGLFFAMSGNNDDNIVTVTAKDGGFGNTWLVRQLDNDTGVDGFENDPISFVYIPGTTEGLIGGDVVSQEGSLFFNQIYDNGGANPITLSQDASGNALVNIGGYTPADGALIALATSADAVDELSEVPPNNAIFAVPQGNDFLIDIRESETFDPAIDQGNFQFIFLPYDSPLERVPNLEFSISGFDATSARGATVTLNQDGTFSYDPNTGDASISGLGNGETVEDTFTYTIEDGRGSTSTATVTVTVQGENQAPTAGDDVVNLNEISAQNASLTVLGNDVDPDVQSLLGTPSGIPAANLSVDGSSNWTVAQTGTGSNAITLGAGTTGNVEVLKDGNPIAKADGVTLATIRENADDGAANYRLVQSYENGTGGTSLALQQFGGDGAADADVSVAHFPFADGWVAGHVDSTGTLTSGNGLTDAEIVRVEPGRYEITIPGVTDAARDGFLYVIGNENADNVASAQAVPLTSTYQVAVRDNEQDFGDGEDGGFSFVFMPRNAQNLVSGVIDPFSDRPNEVSFAIGEFTVERQPVATGGNEWKVTIPGQTPDTGVLILTNQDNGQIEDNFLSYEGDGSGSFLIRSHDMPAMGRQDQPFTFAFIPFDSVNQPAARPVPGLLSIDSVEATSTKGATLSINPDGTINYDPGDVFNGLYDGDTDTDTFTYTMTDGFGGTSSATVTVNIDGFGTGPELSLSSGATYYGVGDEAVGIDGQLDVTSIGGEFYDGAVATFEITQAGLASDTLAIRNEGTGTGQIGVSGSDISFGGTVVATFSGGDNSTPLTITFNGEATDEAVDRVLRAVTFSNADPVVLGGQRDVTISFTDGNGIAADPVVKSLTLGQVYRRTVQQNVDAGYGVYGGVFDVQIRENSPAAVSDPAGDLLVDFDANGNASQVLLRFEELFGTEPGQIPPGSIITSANLVVQTDNPGDGGQFYRMLQDWDADTATWDAFGGGIQPGTAEASGTAESEIGTASGASSTGTGLHSVSVLPDVQAWAAGETNYGWVMDGWDGRTDGWAFRSSENGDPLTGPKLEIEWVPAGQQTVSFRQGVDAYSGTVDTQIQSSDPDADFSTAETVFIDSPTSKALIRFDDIIGTDAGQIPPNADIITARLRTASTTSNAQGDGARFYPMLTSWTDTDTFTSLDNGVEPDGVEAASTFNTSAGNASRDPNVQGGFHDWDVTQDVQSWVNGDRSNNGWLVQFWDGGTDGWGFQTSEAGVEAQRPQLEVVYVEPALTPEIAIVGANSVEVTDGELFVSPLSGTDFGSSDVNTGSLTRTFTIENSGDAALNVGDGVISGDEASAFTFSKVPNATILPGGSSTFEVTFDPTKQGLHDAVVEITSDDGDEASFTFAVQGNGTDFQALSATPDGSTNFAPIGGIDSGLTGAEISAFDPASDRLFVTSAAGLQVIDLSDPTSPTLLSTIAPTSDGATADAVTSVAVNGSGVVAIAVPGADEQADGSVFFYNAADSSFLGSVTVGALPDHVSFTPDGSRVLTANEGEPGGDPEVDPVGSISIVDLSGGVGSATVSTADFTAFDGSEDQLRAAGVKISTGKSVSVDVEPEYLTVAPDGSVAVVTLQENNAVAIVDIASATVVDILPLGYKDHSAVNAAIDPTNNSPDAFALGNFPVRGLYQPDAIANYLVGSDLYFVTANEGDARDAEETDIQSVTLDSTVFPNAASLQDPGSAGELGITDLVGDPDGDGDFDALYSFGGRSFSIWNEAGDLVFDSGDVLARAADALGLYPDGRSDNKGTEPEGVVLGEVDGQTYAFIGLERANATMVFDVTDPSNVVLTQVLNDVNDVSPEGLTFISTADSPNDSPLLVVSNEVSTSLRVYSLGATVIPEVDQVTINDGSDSRSQITSVTVEFNTEVDETALQSAFTLTNIDTNTEVTTLNVATNTAGGKTTAVLTFAPGASVEERDGTGLAGNSLADGNYQLDIAAASVVSSGTQMATDFLFGGQTESADPNDDFFRLLGDANGDGFRNGIDLNAIIPSLFNAEEYREDLDTNGDGSINGIDLNALIPTLFGSPRQ
jgi:VCBS repeat-containing protein